MASQFNENIAKNVQQGRITCNITGWTLLSANGTSNHPSRTHMRLQTQGKAIGVVLALHYVNGVNENGTVTFTAPADSVSVGGKTQFRGTATWVEPVGDKVQVYGKVLRKAGVTVDSSLNVIVTEFA